MLGATAGATASGDIVTRMSKTTRILAREGDAVDCRAPMYLGSSVFARCLSSGGGGVDGERDRHGGARNKHVMAKQSRSLFLGPGTS